MSTKKAVAAKTRKLKATWTWSQLEPLVSSTDIMDTLSAELSKAIAEEIDNEILTEIIFNSTSALE